MGLAPPPTRRQELADFLRQRRAVTSPQAVGLHGNGRRRTPGLRREEVSQLAGIGLSWYTWLEQGREITPSASVLDALARVYDLSGAERGHLFDLAGVPLPAQAGSYRAPTPPELRAVVLELDPYPAYLTGPRTDVMVWNAAAGRLLGEPTRAPDGERNLLWWLFIDNESHGYGMSATARSTLARFRAEHARRYDDPAFRDLIEALLSASPRFRELWRRHEVLDGQLGSKQIEHPELGRLELNHLQTIPTSHPELRLTQLVPADAATRAALFAGA